MNKQFLPIMFLFVLLLFTVLFSVYNPNKEVVKVLEANNVLLSTANSLDNYTVVGELDVNVQDQTTRSIDVRVSRDISTPYYLASDTVINDYEIVLTSVTGLSVGDRISLSQDTTNPALYYAYIISITDNTITTNIPLDLVFSSDYDAVLYEIDNTINEDGSTTPIVYSFSNNAHTPIDITRLMFKLFTDTQPDFSTFGDLDTLSRGLVVRHKFSDGTYNNLFTVRNNGELALLTYDVDFYDANNPAQGVYGVAGRLTFAGQDKHGVAVRLLYNESLEFLAQDDLTDLIDFKIMVEGHYTDEV